MAVALTRDGEACRTCAECPYDGEHAAHGCECDWRNDGHVDPAVARLTGRLAKVS